MRFGAQPLIFKDVNPPISNTTEMTYTSLGDLWLDLTVPALKQMTQKNPDVWTQVGGGGGGGGLNDPGVNGVVIRTALNTTTARTLQATLPLSVSNADGTVGNPGFTVADFIASGVSHARGTVPDPGAVAGSTHFLCEDTTWSIPPGTGVTSVGGTSPIASSGGLTPTISVTDFVASGASHARGTVPDPGAVAGTAKFLREDATWVVPTGGSGIPKPFSRYVMFLSTSGVGAADSQINYAKSVGGTAGTAAPTASLPAMSTYGSGTTANTTTGANNGTGFPLRVGRNIYCASFAGISVTTSVRAWMLFVTDQSLSGMVGNDNPAGNYAAFRFSTNAADTNWMCVTKDGTTQKATSSGVAADTNPHLFEITFNDAVPNVVFSIDGTPVVTQTLNLPTSGTNLKPGGGLANLTTVNEVFSFSYQYFEADK